MVARMTSTMATMGMTNQMVIRTMNDIDDDGDVEGVT